MRVLVCGGRDYQDRQAVAAALDPYLTDSLEIIEGGANGADTLARQWANAHGIKCTTLPADWKTHGNAAGFRRNAEMLTLKPDIVLAFPGGKGTAHMCAIARKAGIRVLRFG